ncbi:MAG: inorganic phosphate transporter [Candidatus Zixiibacteriota bacterium]
MSALLVFVLALVLLAEFVNGWTDAPNAIVTVVSTKVLSRTQAVALAVVFNVIGVLSGTAVATTIGKGIVDLAVVNPPTIAASLIGVIVWGSVAARFGIPTSESHALVAGLAGAALGVAGPEALVWSGWRKVLIGLVMSSAVGLGGGFLLATLVKKAFASTAPAATGRRFRHWQVVSAAFMAFNHGSNDGQKFMGVFAMVLVLGGVLPHFSVPLWVVALCAVTMGIGTSIGGWRIIREMGMRMVDIKPWQGFCAETAAGLTIFSASHFGIPLSTTHSITTSLMGVAASGRISRVRWDIAQKVAWAWLLTFPICAALAFLASLLIKAVFPPT